MNTPRICFTAGVFDLFHVGHVEILTESKKLGDSLIVGVVSDDGTEAYKGRRPQFNERERMDIVAAMRCVDAVFLQPGTDPSPVLRHLAARGMKPDIMTHGDDWDRLIEGNETLADMGIEFRLIPRTRGRYTSRIIEAIREQNVPALRKRRVLGPAVPSTRFTPEEIREAVMKAKAGRSA